MTGRSMPERVSLNARLPRGEAGYWALIREADKRGTWTVPQIEAETNVGAGQIRAYVRKLVKAGVARVEKAETRHNRPLPKEYRLALKQKEQPRISARGMLVVSSQQDCMWRAMRTMRGGFNVRELAHAASLPEQTVLEKAAARYVELLVRAGYLALLQERQGRYGLRVWRLKPSMNTGPLAPTVYRTEAIYDRNLNEIMGACDLVEVAA